MGSALVAEVIAPSTVFFSRAEYTSLKAMLTGAAPSRRAMLAESAPYTRIFLPFQSATVRMGTVEKICCDGQAWMERSLRPFLASISV